MEQRNLTLLTDLYELTMMQGYFKEKDANETVIFDMFYRTNPHGNGFAICAGLEQVIEYIRDLRFDGSDFEYLGKPGDIRRKTSWNISATSALPVISMRFLRDQSSSQGNLWSRSLHPSCRRSWWRRPCSISSTTRA